MGSLDKGILNGVGMLSALLFIVAGALILMSGDAVASGKGSSALYVTAGAGALALITGALTLSERRNTFGMLRSVLVIAAGAVFAASAFAGGSTGTVLAVAGIIAAVAVFMDMLLKWESRIYGAMYISAVFAAAVLCTAVLTLLKGTNVYCGLVPLLFGLCIASDIGIAMVVKDKTPAKTRKVVKDKVAEKKMPEQAKNTKATPKAKPAVAEKQTAKPVVKPVPKAESRKEVPKPESKPAETVKPKQQSAVKPVPKAEPVKNADPMDFMNKVMSSRKAHGEVIRKEEPKPESAKPEEKPAVEEQKAETASATAVAEKLGPKEEPVIVEEPAEEPKSEEPEEEPVIEEPEEVPVVEEIEPEEPKPEEPEEEPVIEEPEEEPVIEEPEEVPVVEEIEPEEPKPEEPKPEEPKPEEPEEPKPEEEPVIEEPEEVPADGSATDAEVQASEPESSVGEKESEVSEADDVHAEEPDVQVEAESEPRHEDDMFTDYSPEAVVRRAAWNKGLRCRREYGDHAIPVAFVKGKVAVFVQPADADTSIDTVLEDEGWTVLRYDEAVITDGKVQGEEIAAAVKSNLRDAKAAAKKKKKTVKK